jgi:hypothetical protein|tara:strand:- start:157 stop:1023 length:867 start_codon:yes stop_codon:yes gene_type:complete
VKLKITKEDHRTICQFVVDGLVCVISKDNETHEAFGYVKGVQLFSGKVEDLEKKAATIKKEIENDRSHFENRIKIARTEMGIEDSIDQNDRYYQLSKDRIREERNVFITKKNKSQIVDVIKERNITKLIHFTDIRNIESILEHGLLPPSRLKERSIESHLNDANRFDNQMGGISVSIMKRNQYLLNSYNKRDPRKWVEIEINPDIAATRNCLFYESNAANSKFQNVKEEYLRSAKAFKNIFANSVFSNNGVWTRENKKDSEPTDLQAEIIVKWMIPNHKILSWKEIDV